MSWLGLDPRLFIKLRKNHADTYAFDIDAILRAYRAAVILGD
jgi:hypothetical protein